MSPGLAALLSIKFLHILESHRQLGNLYLGRALIKGVVKIGACVLRIRALQFFQFAAGVLGSLICCSSQS